MKGIIMVREDPNPELWELPHFIGNTVGAREIADWMSDEIQTTMAQLEEMIATLSRFAREKKPGACLGYGNAHGVFVHKRYVYIECEFVEEQRVLLTTDQAIKALENYRRCMDQLKAQAFPVSYIAQGEDAELQFLDIADVDDLADLVARSQTAHYYS